MSHYKKINLLLILITFGVISLLGILSFTSIQNEIEETNKINAFFSEFENLNQYQTQDTITPNVVTYSQLNNFDEKNNYLNNRKDISKNVTTYSQKNIPIPTGKHYDVSNRVTTYSALKSENTSKKQDVSSLVTVYKPQKEVKKETKTQKSPNKIANKTIPNSQKKSIPLKKVTAKKSKPKKKIVPVKTKQIAKKKTSIAIPKKKSLKKEIVVPAKPVVSKKRPMIPKKKSIVKSNTFKKEKATATLHYAKKELNTATNINLIESAPVYPNCQNKTTENDKKGCLLTNVSKFVLDHFNGEIAKKTGLKKGFYEIRVLFIIDEKGTSKTYKVLGKYHPSVKNEIKRIINQLPKMIPGKSNGKNVPVKYSIKVLFEVK